MDKESAAEFHQRANEVRKIVQNIFDKDERRFVMKFVKDSEEMQKDRT
jgi:hypothetical protein